MTSSASDFFGAYFPVFAFLFGLVCVAFALECLVGAIGLTITVFDQLSARRDARQATPHVEISRASTLEGGPTGASGITEATTLYGGPARTSAASNDAAYSGCRVCQAVRISLLRLRRAVSRT